ncbi:hypothetical protein RB195_000974 [Necator americanus]|uniref:Uncharacterized protein n=1 Tax=Necator americanus TaxID=51031 RepID=A0ABR1DCN7_NECAM
MVVFHSVGMPIETCLQRSFLLEASEPANAIVALPWRRHFWRMSARTCSCKIKVNEEYPAIYYIPFAMKIREWSTTAIMGKDKELKLQDF